MSMRRVMAMMMAPVLAAGMLAGCGATSANTAEDEGGWEAIDEPAGAEVDTEDVETMEAATAATTEDVEVLTDPIQEALNSMTTWQKVGQLFVIAPEQLDTSQDVAVAQTVQDTEAETANPALTSVTELMAENMATYPVGGIILFAQNITDPNQLGTFMGDLQAASEEPLLFSVDEEGGLVARLANNDAFNLPKYKNAATVASSGNPDDVYEMSATIGGYLKQYGFNLDFAPDADVNSNPNNPVIGTRSFSSDPQVAATMVAAAVNGFHEKRILTTLKHFPGHGDTGEDSHLGTATSYKTYEEMQSCEMLPFEAGIAAGTDVIMTAHITTPNATDDGLPASLSYTWLTERLRGDLGYEGVIVTDALRMEAIADYYGSVDAAVMAFNAGADMLLLPADYIAAYDGVYAAVQDGTISEERLDESVYRILELKSKAGLVIGALND